jgi:hypothetical protein
MLLLIIRTTVSAHYATVSRYRDCYCVSQIWTDIPVPSIHASACLPHYPGNISEWAIQHRCVVIGEVHSFEIQGFTKLQARQV